MKWNPTNEWDLILSMISFILCVFRYAFPWWKEKEIVSETKRSQGLCPLTPEEAALILRALGFDNNTQIYIASGEIYGSERRLAALRTAFPRLVSNHFLHKSWYLISYIWFFLHPSFLILTSDEKGGATTSWRFASVPESFLPNGSPGFYCFSCQ